MTNNFKLSDDKTLIVFHHNKSSVRLADLGRQPKIPQDRLELWFATSTDDEHTWTEPRFLLATGLKETFESTIKNYNTSYYDMLLQDGQIHLFMPHRWSRVFLLQFAERQLNDFLLGMSC